MPGKTSLSRTSTIIVLAAAVLLLTLGQRGNLAALQDVLSTVMTPLQQGLVELIPKVSDAREIAPQALLDRNATLVAEIHCCGLKKYN